MIYRAVPPKQYFSEDIFAPMVQQFDEFHLMEEWVGLMCLRIVEYRGRVWRALTVTYCDGNEDV
jgi:hypothetical protein